MAMIISGMKKHLLIALQRLPEDLLHHIVSFIPSREQSRHAMIMKELSRLYPDVDPMSITISSNENRCTDKLSYVFINGILPNDEYMSVKLGTYNAMKNDWRQHKRYWDRQIKNNQGWLQHEEEFRRNIRENRQLTLKEYCRKLVECDSWYGDRLYWKEDEDEYFWDDELYTVVLGFN